MIRLKVKENDLDMETNNKKSGVTAFFPILVFVVVYLGAGIFYQLQGVPFAFYQLPAFGAMLISIAVAFLWGKEKFEHKFTVFVQGIGNSGVVTMLLVYIFAGAFSGIATAMGGRDATVNLGLSVIPVQFLAAGVFIISGFMGVATGTSIGTISAIAPIAVGLADKGNLNVGIVIGACVGGAMFGDNLSMISDTTIAATTTQGVGMKDKFRVNLLIAVPAAIVNIILLIIFGRPESAAALEGGLNCVWYLILPYILVFVLAIIGINVFIVLILGILSAEVIGVLSGAFSVAEGMNAVYSGVTGMDEVFYLTLLMAGIAAMVQHNGGVEWLLGKINTSVKNAKSAQLLIAFIVAVLDLATATNTVAIILSGDLAKKISRKYKVDPRRTASLLDIFSCVFQGILPYSGQLLLAAGFTAAAGYSLTAVNFIPYIWYSLLLGVFGILSIYLPFADGYLRKHPWNWETSGEEVENA